MVQAVFIFDQNILKKLEDKKDKRVTFIYDEIARLSGELKEKGSKLWVFYGKPKEVFNKLFSDFNITEIFANRDYEPYARDRDKTIYEMAAQKGIPFKGFKDQVIFDRNEILTSEDKPYSVFSPYAKKWREKCNDFFLSSYPTEKYFENLRKADDGPKMPTLGDMGFEREYLDPPSREPDAGVIKAYDKTRNFPAKDNGTTRLGVHLRFGTISIRQLASKAQKSNSTFLNELIWRDFYQMVLYHNPKSGEKAIKPVYDQIEWENSEDHFEAWSKGETGYPLVDAGMRELNETGYMHNRVRMVAASFLVKHLLVDWRWGEAYFAKKLLDYDMAANVGGWQWAAGSGNDAVPYFRIFNPEAQLEKFDRDHKYVKRWVPEYGSDKYPQPIVDHKEARQRALERYKAVVKN